MLKKNRLSREEALNIYKDLQRSVVSILQKEPVDSDQKPVTENQRADRSINKGKGKSIFGKKNISNVVYLVILLAITKIGVSIALIFSIDDVNASSYNSDPIYKNVSQRNINVSDPSIDIDILKSLEQSRAKLEERESEIKKHETELKDQEKLIAVRLAELRQLTGDLNIRSKKDEQRRETQVKQLANVYESMNPAEAAPLLEQLDIAIALNLIKRMPNKRVGQLLSLMSNDRALLLTRMLTGE